MNDNKMYSAPDMDILLVICEQGFANSIEDPFINDEREW